jgi:CelD/BcsL family acetyltransferase involved in cellulose biosynthesis
MLRIECLPHDSDLWSRVAPVWAAVYARSGTRSAFLAAGWVSAWIEAFGSQLRPAALIWRDSGDDPVGVALLSLRLERAGPMRIRAAYLNATGEQRVASEHNRILCVPECREAVLDGLRDHLRGQSVEMLRLCGFEIDDAEALQKRWPRGPSYGFVSEDRHVRLDELRQQQQPYLQTLSRNTREQVRRSLRLYEQTYGPIACERITDPTAMGAAFEELCALHEARWRARGEAGVFADERVLRFPAALRRAQPAGGAGSAPAVEFLRVRCGDTTIGLLYNLLHGGRVNFYQSGLRYEADGKLKPGLVTHALAVQRYAEAGYDEYDFLAGEADTVQYKMSLGRESRPLVWRDLSAPGLKMRAIQVLRLLRRQLRSRGGWR